VSRTPLN